MSAFGSLPNVTAAFLAPKLCITWSLLKTDYERKTKKAACFLCKRGWGRLKDKFWLAFHIPHEFHSVGK